MKCGASNWKANSSSVALGDSSASPRYIRITSSDFSFRLWAFSVLRARMRNATSGSGTRIAGTRSALSFWSTTRRWLPFGVQ